MIEVKQVAFSYGRRHALRGVSLCVEAGVTCLLGPNGAGKTTLLKCLVGLLAPRSGYIEVEGLRITDRQHRASAQRQIGYVPQNATMPGLIRVEDAIVYAGWLSGLSGAFLAERTEVTLRELGLVELRRRRVRTLSGGQRQRVSLATGLVHDPAVLVLDEPTASLDPAQRLRVRRIIKELASARSVIVSTHLAEDVKHVGDKVAVLASGEVHFDGPASEFAALARAMQQPTAEDGSEFELAYEHMMHQAKWSDE